MSSFLNSSYNALTSGASYVASGVSSGFSYGMSGISSGLSYVTGLVSSKEEPKHVLPTVQEIAQNMQPSLQTESITKKNAASYDPEDYMEEPPKLDPPTNFNQSTHSSIIIAEMLTRSQRQALSAEDSATLKFEIAQHRLQKHQKLLKAHDHKITDVNLQVAKWESYQRYTSYALSGISIASGAFLLASSNPTGGYLMVSGAGSLAAQLMQDYNFNQTAITLTSLGSALFSLGGGFYHLFKSPTAITTGLTKAIENGALVFNTLAGALNSYSTYKKSENMSEVKKVEAHATIVETEVKKLLDKFPGIATTFHSASKSAADIIKNLVRAHTRSCDATKMVVASFNG